MILFKSRYDGNGTADVMGRNISTDHRRVYIRLLCSRLLKFTARLVRSQLIPMHLSYAHRCFGMSLCLELGGALSGAWWMSTCKLAVNWHSPAALIQIPQEGDFAHVNSTQYGIIPYTQNIKHGNKKYGNKALRDSSLHFLRGLKKQRCRS